MIRRQALAWIAAAPWGFLPLAACSTPPKRQQFPNITYEHLPPFRLDVATIGIIAADSDPNIEDVGGEFPQAPRAALETWAQDRFQAVGNAGQGTITLLEAKAVNTPLPRSPALSAVDLSDQYELTFAVKIAVENPQLGRSAEANAKARRTQTIREDMTINQREGVLFSLLDQCLKDLNAEIEKLMPRYFSAFLR